ncbi:hypothetical protein ACHAXT_000705 [Thalassiosira profunda]
MPARASRDGPSVVHEAYGGYRGSGGYYDNGHSERYQSNGYDESYTDDGYHGYDDSYRDNGYDERYRSNGYGDSYRDQYDDERYSPGAMSALGKLRTVQGEGERDHRSYPPPPAPREYYRRDEYDDYDRADAYDDYTADYSLPQHGTDGSRRIPRDPSVAGSVAPVNASGEISTASASAITFDTRSSSAQSEYTSKRSRGAKSKSTRRSERSPASPKSKASTASRHQVIPVAVSFPAKGQRGASNSERRPAEENTALSLRSSAKPRPPLRKPDAAKSREIMRGRGKSSKSVASSAVASGADRSRRRSRSSKMHRGEATRELMDGDRDAENGGRRSLSRGRATRQLNSAEGYDRRGDRRKSRNRDGSCASGDASVKSHSTHSSWRSVRHDVDEEGYCAHHPDVRLMKLKRDGDWRVLRKKCPECIREDCPAMLGHSDDRSQESRSEQRRKKHHVSSSDIYHVSERGDFDAAPSASSSVALDSMGAFAELGLTFQTPEEVEEEEATHRLKRRLAARAYHFPGNSWCQDWMQYLSNTHTVLGLFFHHPLHPMGFQERLVILFGSIAIGLTISNFTYLFFIRNGIDVEEEVFTLNSRHTDVSGIPVVSITKLMITLWTMGSFLHTCFDLGLWHMKACTLCRYRGRISEKMVMWGRVAGLFIVMIAMGVGGYAVLVRASLEYRGEGSVADEVEESIQSNELYSIEFEDKRSFRFLLGYLVEFVLALFVYYPLAVTVLFSGVLGCGGRIPILGGRPREMAKEQRYELSKRRPKILKAFGGEEALEDGNGETVASTTDVLPMAFRDDESRERFDEREVI